MSMPSVRASVVSASALIFLGTASALRSQPAARRPAPVIGKSARYSNPLPLPATSADGSPRGVSLGDVTVMREGDLYHLFGSGGGAWLSPDLVNWKYQAGDVRGDRLPVAPHITKYDGAFYMSGNSAPLYRAPNILGLTRSSARGRTKRASRGLAYPNGRPWTGAFDVDIFVDNNSKP